jgi:hypothetical protein
MSNPASSISVLLAATSLATALILAAPPVSASPILGTASDFAVLGSASVTNTGSTVITGNVGISGGTSITGFYPPGIVSSGTIHLNDGPAIAANSDFLAAYVSLGGSVPTQNLTGLGDLGVGALGSLTAGVYKFDSTAQLTGALTLDGGGDPNAQFIFLIGSSLTTASASSILLTNSAFFDNVYWWTDAAATLGSGTAFAGSILAGTSISLNDGASIVCGRALAKASVTMISNQISNDCEQGPGGVDAVPEPSTFLLLGFGLLTAIGFAFRRRRERHWSN